MTPPELARIIDRYLDGHSTIEERKFVEQWLAMKDNDLQQLDEPEKEMLRTALWNALASKADLVIEEKTAADIPPVKVYKLKHTIRYAAAGFERMLAKLFSSFSRIRKE